MKEAGAESLSFQLLNRNVDQPFKYVATWLIDEWSKIGLHVTQRVVPDAPLVRRNAQRKSRRTRLLHFAGGVMRPHCDPPRIAAE